MSIKIANYEFEGPYQSVDNIKNQPGLYAVILQTTKNLFLLDLGESENVKSKIKSHERKKLWDKYATQGDLVYSTCYVKDDDKNEREQMINEINKVYKTPFNKE